MNAIIYIRVSTTEQAELGYSLKAQEEICKEYAEKNNYNILKVFREEGGSAKNTNRTELQKLLKFIKENKKDIDLLIIYKLDRLSRDVYDALTLRILFNELGIELRSVTEPFDDSPIGKFTANLFSSIAQLDNDIRSERTTIGMKQAVKEGRWLWQAPTGFKLEKKDGKSYLVIDKSKANIIKEIFTLFDEGYRGKDLLSKIKEIGLNLSKQTMSKILRNVAYKGKIKVVNWFGDEEIDGLHEPIIEEELFDRVNFKLGIYKNFQKPKTKIHEEFPLRGIIYCPICGNKLTAAFSTGRSKKYPYYRCSTKGCEYRSKNKYEVENSFNSYLKKLTPKNHILGLFKNSMEDIWKENNKLENNNIKILNNKIKQLDNKIDYIIELHSKSLIDDDDFTNRYNKLKTEKQNIEIALSENVNNFKNIDNYLDFGIGILKDLKKFWVNSSLESKHNFLSLMFPEGLYYKDKKVGTTKNATILEVFKDKNHKKSMMVGEGGLEPPCPYEH